MVVQEKRMIMKVESCDMEPLISVIIPVYNVKTYLLACYTTVKNQTYKNLEIILVDDGSTDSSGKMCDEYALEDERVKVIHKINGGLSDARNAGLDIMTGEYVTCIDSDDIVSPDYISTLYTGAKQFDTDITVGTMRAFYESDYITWGQLIGKNDKCEWQCLNRKDTLSKILLQAGVDVSACAKLYRSSLFEKIRYPLARLYEDLATTYKLIDCTNKVAITSKPIYGYRRNREGSITKSGFSMKEMELMISYKEFYDFILKNYPELKREANVRYAVSAGIILESLYLADEESNNSEIAKEMKNIISSYKFDLLFSSEVSIQKKVKVFVARHSKKIYLHLYRMYFK